MSKDDLLNKLRNINRALYVSEALLREGHRLDQIRQAKKDTEELIEYFSQK